MADDAIDFASLMCSRLCHDLLSPVGSFGNGLELLADESDPAMRQNIAGLLESSSRSAANKLKYFRLAFGSSGGYGEAIAVDEVVAAVRGLVNEGRDTDVNWLGAMDSLPKPAARVLLLLAQLAVESLVRGGRIDMAVEPRDGGLEIALRAAGDRLVVDAASAAMLEASAEPAAKTIGIALARAIATARGGQIMASRPSATELVMGAYLPA